MTPRRRHRPLKPLAERLDPATGGRRMAAPTRWEPYSAPGKAAATARAVFWTRWNIGVDEFQNMYGFFVNNLPPALSNLLNPALKGLTKKDSRPAGGGIEEIITANRQGGYGR